MMRMIAKGDHQAFAQLVDQYKDVMVAFLTRLTGSPERAEDMAQETFIKVFENAASYQEQGKLSSYMYRIASNQALSILRREHRRGRLRRWFVADTNGQKKPRSPERALHDSQVQQQVSLAIATLPVKYRVPLVLHELEGLGFAQVALAIKAAEGTVKSRVFRGRQMLKKKLAHLVDGGGS